MKEFDKLITITDKLLGLGGCPWDHEQTFKSIRSTVLEEVHELIEAIDDQDPKHILEEVGDLFFNAVFFCKLGEKEGWFTTEQVIQQLTDKLVRRHPHVFEKKDDLSSEEVLHQWEEIKKLEKTERKHPLDGIPKNFPALMRAQKIVKRLKITEREEAQSIGERLWNLVQEAQEAGVDAELALMEVSRKHERIHRNDLPS